MAKKQPAHSSHFSSAKVSGQTPPVINAPLVFISHDHRDAELAERFEMLLRGASGGVIDCFRSSDKKGTSGIAFGQEWYHSVMEKLNRATHVIALLTPHSIDRPWILYETGVAKGKLNIQAFGVAFATSLAHASTGPFAQFQNSDSDEDSLSKLLTQVIAFNPSVRPPLDAIRLQVRTFLQEITPIVGTLSASPIEEAPASSTIQLFQEIKLLLSDVPLLVQRVKAIEAHQRGHSRPTREPLPYNEIDFSIVVENQDWGVLLKNRLAKENELLIRKVLPSVLLNTHYTSLNKFWLPATGADVMFRCMRYGHDLVITGIQFSNSEVDHGAPKKVPDSDSVDGHP